MPSMLLSSVRRLRAFAAGLSSDALSDDPKNNRLLTSWLSAVSGQIEQYCARTFLIEQRTEYFDLINNRTVFYVESPIITTLTSVYEDADGEFSGSESEITDAYIGIGGRSVVLPFALGYNARKAIRIIYTGGLAYHAVNSTWTVSAGKSYVVGSYIIGSSSGAVGIVVSYSSTTLVVENYYGIFTQGETITQHAQENGDDAASVTDTLTTIVYKSLAESYPDIVTAAEIQIRYMWKHTADIENQGTNKDGTTIRKLSPAIAQRYALIDEARDMLNPHMRVAVI